MLAVKGVFKQGRARPIHSIQGREGQSVIITFLEEPMAIEVDSKADVEDAWLTLSQLVDSCAVETGITDLAHRHDKSWGLTDCISFTVMRERKLTDAFTSDHHFTQAGFIKMLSHG